MTSWRKGICMVCIHVTNSQGKEVMKRHLWMEKKKSRIMVRNLKSKQ